MEFLIYLIVFIAGYLVGHAYAKFKISYALFQIFEKSGIDVKKEMAKLEKNSTNKFLVNETPKLEVEQINDQLYLYTKDKDFICQAKSLEDLAKAANDYNNIKLALVLHETKTFMFIDGTLKEVI